MIPEISPDAADNIPPVGTESKSATPLVLTAAEVAAIFHKSARSWHNWDATGKVPRPIRIGRSTFWRPDEIQAWIAAGCPDRETWELANRDQPASVCR